MSLDPGLSDRETSVSVPVGNNTSNSIALSTWSPQGCVLSLLLFTLLTHDCASRHEGNQINKSAADTTGVGLIYKNEESMYREEVKHLEGRSRENNLALDADEKKEMIFDFWRSQPEQGPLSISGHTVERMESIKFLRVQILQNLIWNKNTSGITKWAQQRLYCLKKLKQAFPHQHPQDFLQWCGGERSSALTWYSSCSMSDK